MRKHAYMILCHNNFEQLQKLLKLLDDKRNDIYIHLDKKTPFNDFKRITESVVHSNIEWIDRVNVSWAGFSQIRAELLLLKAATKTKHSYYHLISGADLPIKSQDEIHEYFDRYEHIEFISVEESTEKGYDVYPRIGQYHFLQDKIGRNKGYKAAISERLEMFLLNIQKLLRVNRIKNLPVIYKGAQWFSITHNMALYILSREKDIVKMFKFGMAVDELFVQTIAMQSPYASYIDCDYKRLIDWNRGQPYTWKIEDYDEIRNSDKLFARKFDYTQDSKIIDKIFSQIKN